MGPRAGLDGRKILSPPGFFLSTPLLILQYANAMVAWKISVMYCLGTIVRVFRIALFVCYSSPLRERRYVGEVFGQRSPCRYGTVTQISGS